MTRVTSDYFEVTIPRKYAVTFLESKGWKRADSNGSWFLDPVKKTNQSLKDAVITQMVRES